ncbi:bile acid-CoA:amino acid N-acyltransferase-like [Patiria miniata]|uniref:Uncharacterized protein n=1 Tax=Patiria miniata TaxID=46514 RepID=A0A914BP08_PATMI|nr:bile acid-CoA:amino acid N-acyltransferase-like [Patiria miniata]
MATISVSPSSSLMDERVVISVAGLASHCPVTVRSHVTEITKRFQGWAHLIADEDGRVSLDKDPSIGGTYSGVEPMGLFWSLQPCPGQQLGIRFAKKHPDKPVVVILSLHRGHLDETQLATDEPIHVAVAHKWYMRETDVDRIKLTGHDFIRGVVYKPKGPGPFPAVLDMFGTAGGLMEFRAALLASRGYASYALPIFAYEDLSETMLNVDFEYFEEALKWFAAQSYVQPGGIGIVASSMGGSIGLHLAIKYPQLIKATAFVSCPPFMPNVTLNYRGKALPFVWFDTEATTFDDEGVLHPLTGWPAARDIKDKEFIELFL